MSRAYCLTCNEQVTETPAGTCPSGHPVTTHDSGPEPWVGFVGDDTTTARPAPAVEAERPQPQLSRIDAAGQPLAHAVNGAPSPAVNGHANGHANGRTLGGGHGANDPFPSTFGHRSSFAPDETAAPTERAPASGPASDDLAALLAEALGSAEPSADAPEDGPGLFDHAPASPEPQAPAAEETAAEPVASETTEATAGTAGTETTGGASEDWDDLASLAAELQLDAVQQSDDVMPADHVAPPAEVVGDDLAAADLDALMAELGGDTLPAEDVATAPPALEEAPVEPPASAAAPAMPPPTWDPTPLGDAPPPPEPVPSAPPAPETVAPWDTPTAALEDPAPWDDPAPGAFDEVPGAPTPDVAATVDLGNFTANGRPVARADTGGGGSRKKSFGRKKR